MRATRALAGSLVLLLAGACGGSPSPNHPVRTVASTTTTPTSTTLPPTTTTSEAPQRLAKASRSAQRPRVTAAPKRGCVNGLRFCWTDDPFDALSACEAGMQPTRIGGGGRFRGAFQFDMDTWHANGGEGDPIDHSYAEQKAVAQFLQSRRGWSPWPTCSRKLGLR